MLNHHFCHSDRNHFKNDPEFKPQEFEQTHTHNASEHEHTKEEFRDINKEIVR